MQITIAVCDDELQIGSQLEKILISLLVEREIAYQIDIFTTGEELCEELQKTEYDLLFLDIEFPSMNGVAVGAYIRETLGNDVLQIAYISARQEGTDPYNGRCDGIL